MASHNQRAAGWGWRVLGRLGTEVRIEESRLASALFAYSFLLGAFQMAAKSIRQASFVDSLGYERLPFVYLVVALASYPVLRVYGRLCARVPLHRLIPRITTAVIASLVGFWWLFSLPSPWVRFVFYIWISIVTLLVFSQFWSWTSELLHSRQARRLFAFILSGGLIGGVFGGQIARWAAELVDTRATLLAGAALLLGSLALVPRIRTHVAADSQGQFFRPAESVTDATGVVSEIWRSPHLRAVAGLLLVSIMVAQVIDLQFNWVVEQSTDHLDQRTGLYGNLFSLIGLTAFGLQIVLTPRIHQGAGVGTALRVMPVGLAAGCIALLLTAVFVPAALLLAVAAMKLGEGALRYSLDQGTRELLFVPVAEDRRARVKAFIDVFVQRLARALAAVLLLTVTFGWISPLQATWLTLGLLGAWLLLTVSVRRHYVASFREGLLSRRIDPEERLDPTDITTLEVLVGSLGSSDPQEVLHALDLLRSQGRGHLVPPLLLHHEDAEVRRRTLELLRQLGRRDALELVERAVTDVDEEVRVAAVRTLAALSEPDGGHRMRARLGDQDPRVRAAAIVCLVDGADPDAARSAHRALAEMLHDGDPGVRTQAAQALGSLTGDDTRHHLVRLLSDADVGVARAAISSVRQHTAARGMNPLYVPILVSLLRKRRLKYDAREALVACGGRVVPILAHFMNDRREDYWVRWALPKTLARLGGKEAMRALVAGLETEDALLRRHLSSAITGLCEAQPDLPIQRDRIAEQVQHELRLYLRSFARLATVSPAGVLTVVGVNVHWRRGHRPSLLQQILVDRMRDHSHNLFRLLAILLHDRQVAGALAQLRSRDPKVRNHALEFIDQQLPNDLRASVLAVIDDIPIDKRLESATRLFYIAHGDKTEVLRSLVEGAEDTDVVGRWLGAAALSFIDEDCVSELYPMISTTAARPGPPLIRETAQWVLDRWGGPQPSLRSAR